MRTLVLDTATNLLYISFIEDNKVIYEVNSLGLNNHSDHLLPLIEEGLIKNNLEVKESFECGVKLAKYDDIKIGDIIESFEIEKTAVKFVAT